MYLQTNILENYFGGNLAVLSHSLTGKCSLTNTVKGMGETYSEEDVENDAKTFSDGEEAQASEEGTQEEESEDDAILIRKVYFKQYNIYERVYLLKSS